MTLPKRVVAERDLINIKEIVLAPDGSTPIKLQHSEKQT
jgi:hypothetical protein